MSKKGQAAMEFLMTYGWAILAAIIAIGVLYLIIGNPSNLAGDQYKLSNPFIAGGKSAATTGVTLEFRNGAGESVTVSNVSVENCGTNSNSFIVADGALQAVTVSCALTAGNRVKGAVTISYTTAGSTVTQKSTGELNLKVS